MKSHLRENLWFPSHPQSLGTTLHNSTLTRTSAPGNGRKAQKRWKEKVMGFPSPFHPEQTQGSVKCTFPQIACYMMLHSGT